MTLLSENLIQEVVVLFFLVPCAILATDNVRQNLIDTIRRHLEPAEQETKTLGLNDGGFIKSVNYPSECCESRQYLIEYNDEASSEGYLRMVFEDLDLPKGTMLQVHDGINMSAPAFFEQPYFRKGAWIRPVFASTGPSLFMKLTSRKNNPVSVDHVGFKANVWTSSTGPNTWTLNKPFTECPVIADAVDGGSLTLSTLLLFGKTNFRYDCIWQLRPPKDSSGNLKLFLKITDVDLIDGLVIIKNGLSSESEQDLRIEGTTSSLNEDSSRTFTSQKGFYIRIKKPVETGHINFTFGVFLQTSKSDCTLKIEGKKIPGFKCQMNDWCVPHEYKCNGIPQCPDGSDENTELCVGYEVSTVIVPTTINPPRTTTMKPVEVQIGEIMDSMCTALPTLYKKCDDGRCVSKYTGCEGECGVFDRKCSDGTCVNKNYGTCPTEKRCNYNQKKCSDHTCVDSRGKCTNEVCPDYKPNECRNRVQCYYDSDRCSGFSDCSDSSDEDNCPVSVEKSPWGLVTETWKLWLLALLIPLMCCCCGYCKYKRRKRRRSRRNDEARRAQSGPAVTGAEPTGSVDHYIERGHNERNERQQLMTNGANAAQMPASTPFYSDNTGMTGPPPAAPPPAYSEAVDRAAYPPTQPSTDTQLPSYDEAMR